MVIFGNIIDILCVSNDIFLLNIDDYLFIFILFYFIDLG